MKMFRRPTLLALATSLLLTGAANAEPIQVWYDFQVEMTTLSLDQYPDALVPTLTIYPMFDRGVATLGGQGDSVLLDMSFTPTFPFGANPPGPDGRDNPISRPPIGPFSVPATITDVESGETATFFMPIGLDFSDVSWNVASAFVWSDFSETKDIGRYQYTLQRSAGSNRVGVTVEEPIETPEPGTLLLAGIGIGGACLFRKIRRRKSV